MDGRGGCCIARYTAAGGGGGAAGGGSGVSVAYDLSKMDRIMLRYRPIAPKPTAGGGPVFRDDHDVPSKSGGGSGRGGRRRYVKDNNSNGNNGNGNGNSGASKRGCGRKRKASPPEEHEAPVVVTLPLLPEKPDKKDSPPSGSSSEVADVGGVVKKMVKNAPIWLSFGDSAKLRHVGVDGGHVAGFGCGGGVMIPSPRVVGSSWVKVECVTDTWVDAYALGCTDEEKLMNLHGDTCPGFISDGENRVRWSNSAYKDMVGCGSGGREGEEVVVFLGLKEGTRLPSSCNAFTCHVKVVTYKKDKIKNEHKGISSHTLPCDVWRLDGGGFAWRLDTKAALSLGR